MRRLVLAIAIWLSVAASANAQQVFSPSFTLPAPVTNSIGSNVVLNSTSTFFDGPAVATGAVGTWLAWGTVTLQDTAGAAAFYCKLWDGTTVIASGAVNGSAASVFVSMGLSGTITTPGAQIKISCEDTSSTSGLILFNATGASKDSTVTALRLK